MKMIVFDLDGTLAESKSPIKPSMADLLIKLLDKYHICIISGGKFEQIRKQVIAKMRFDNIEHQIERIHIMPVSGGQYWRFLGNWRKLYSHDLSAQQKKQIIDAIESSVKELGFECQKSWGQQIEDRECQITFSALGQQAPAHEKAKWDSDCMKKIALRDEVANKLNNALDVRIGGMTSIDITKHGIDKAFGMAGLCSWTLFNYDDILFIGDRLQEGGNDYPVIKTGIKTIQVDNPKDTEMIIKTLLAL